LDKQVDAQEESESTIELEITPIDACDLEPKRSHRGKHVSLSDWRPGLHTAKRVTRGEKQRDDGSDAEQQDWVHHRQLLWWDKQVARFSMRDDVTMFLFVFTDQSLDINSGPNRFCGVRAPDASEPVA
jgi:hypothetical protein